MYNDKVKVTQLCPTFCGRGILQVRILGWVAISFSRGSFQPRDQAQVSHIAGGFFTSWATRNAQEDWNGLTSPSSQLRNIEVASPALQADSLPAELLGKPMYNDTHSLNYPFDFL